MYSGYNFYDRQRAAKVSQVNDPNAAWVNQEPHWILIEDLQGGSYEMRRKHRRYLPQEPRELDDCHTLHLVLAVLAVDNADAYGASHSYRLVNLQSGSNVALDLPKLHLDR